jgi:hypothetical protein
MTNKIVTFRPDPDMFEAMLRTRERDGVPFAVQIRRAMRAWLEETERFDVWTKATLDDDENAFSDQTPTQIRAAYLRWKVTL